MSICQVKKAQKNKKIKHRTQTNNKFSGSATMSRETVCGHG